jgi:sugar transferase (PEP-CTERM system associated)
MPLDNLSSKPLVHGLEKNLAETLIPTGEAAPVGSDVLLRDVPHDPPHRFASDPIVVARSRSQFAREFIRDRQTKPKQPQKYAARRYLPDVITTLSILDIFCIGAAQIVTVPAAPDWISLSAQAQAQAQAQVLVVAAISTCVNMLFLHAVGMYRRETLSNLRGSVLRAVAAIGFASIALFVWRTYGAGIVYPSKLDGLTAFQSSAIALVGAAVSLLSIVVSRALAWALLSRRVFTRRVLVIGSGKRAEYLKQLMEQASHRIVNELLFVPESVLGSDESDASHIVLRPGAHLTGRQAESLLRDHMVDEIVLAVDDEQNYSLEPLLAYKASGIPVVGYNAFIERETDRVDLNRPDLSWLVFSDGFRFSFIDICTKRTLDVLVSLVALIVSAPVLLGAIAAVACESGSAIFFKQQRVTLNGRTFWLYKIRTMRQDAESSGPKWSSAKDPRITRVGFILRRFRIDEIPQLINVLRGDMSLVGPRPEQPLFVEQLARDIRFYNLRHTVKAGITGWAQINYPYGATTDDAVRKLEFDLYYIKNYSLLRELSIMLQTVRVLFWPPSAN